MGMSDWCHIDVEEVVAETDEALLLRVEGEEVWVSRSVIADQGDYCKGDEEVTVSIKEWWCERKGLV